MMFTKRGDRVPAEATALAEARHPGVVELIDTAGDVLRTRMVEGRPLAAMGPLNAAEVAGVAAAVAATLADLHEFGIVHGGINASHVLVATDGRPLLCSLGRGGDPADDVAALGLLVTDLLTKALPEDRGGPRLPRNPRRLGTMLAPPVAPALTALADKAMATEPVDRPTARAFADAIRQHIPAARLPEPTLPRCPERRRVSSLMRTGGNDRRHHTGPAFPMPGRVRRSGRTQRARRRTGSPAVAARGGGMAGFVAVGAVLVGITLAGTWALSRQGGPADLIPATERSGEPRTASGAHSCTPACASADPSVPRTPHPSMPAEPVPAQPAPPSTPASSAPVATRVWPGEPLELRDGVLTYGGSRYALGDPGDSLVAGDWDCSGAQSLALLRRHAGQIFAFDGWPDDEETLTARPVGQVEDAVRLRAVDLDGDGCHELEVERQAAPPVRLRVR